jgi:hypothetical protein
MSDGRVKAWLVGLGAGFGIGAGLMGIRYGYHQLDLTTSELTDGGQLMIDRAFELGRQTGIANERERAAYAEQERLMMQTACAQWLASAQGRQALEAEIAQRKKELDAGRER